MMVMVNKLRKKVTKKKTKKKISKIVVLPDGIKDSFKAFCSDEDSMKMQACLDN